MKVFEYRANAHRAISTGCLTISPSKEYLLGKREYFRDAMSTEESARVTSKGQITIPKAIRDRLGIKEGTTVTFEIRDDGTVTLSPRRDSWELLEEIQEAPRRTDKNVEELMSESDRAWSKYG